MVEPLGGVSSLGEQEQRGRFNWACKRTVEVPTCRRCLRVSTKRAQKKGRGSHAEAHAINKVCRAEYCKTAKEDTG